MNQLRDQLLAALAKTVQGGGGQVDLATLERNLEKAAVHPDLNGLLGPLLGAGGTGTAQLPDPNQVLQAIAGLVAGLGPEERKRLGSVLDDLGQAVESTGDGFEAIRTLKATLGRPRS